MSTYSGTPAPAADLSFLPDHRFNVAGTLREWTVEGDTVRLQGAEALLSLTFFDDDVLRVRFAPNGRFAEHEPFSYALDPERRWPRPRVEVKDEGDHLRMETASMVVRVMKDPMRLDVALSDGRALVSDAAGAGAAHSDDGTSVRCWKQKRRGERFFGLGDKTFPLDRTGRSYTLWNSDTYAYAPEQDPIYKSIPFVMGLHENGAGYGLYFDNTFQSEFDLGEASPDRWHFGATGGELRYFIFAGPELSHVLKRYRDLTGHKPMPPRWSLGYHQSRWNYHDDGYARWIAHEFRRRGLPLECVHLDIGHMDGYRVFTFDDKAFPDPNALTEDLAAIGVKTVVIVDPGVKIDPGYFAYDEGVAGNHFHRNPDGRFFTGTVWPGDVHWPDFSRRLTREWWGRLHRHYLAAGVKGIWNDMNEPAILGGVTFPDDVRFDLEGRGGDHREGHNLYGMLMAKSTYEGLLELRPDERPFLLTRACFAGSQRYAAAWTGDNVSTWEHLLLSIRICQGLSMSGLAFCGPDIGGFAGQPSPELYARWMQAGVFFPFMRTHYSHEEIDKQEPWSFGEETEAVSRRYIGLRYELMPYLYTAFVDCAEGDLPPMTALVLRHQDDPHTIAADDQFYFGPALMAAPVVTEGADRREVYFPEVEGGWFDFWTNEAVEGGQTRTVRAPLDVLPIYARAGSVVAMQGVVMHTDEEPPDVLALRTYPGTPGQTASSTLYHDDGISYAYRDGDFLRLTFEQTASVEALRLAVSRDGDGELPYRTFEWQIPLSGLAFEPGTVLVDGEPVSREDDPKELVSREAAFTIRDGRLRIRTRTDVETVEVTA